MDLITIIIQSFGLLTCGSVIALKVYKYSDLRYCEAIRSGEISYYQVPEKSRSFNVKCAAVERDWTFIISMDHPVSAFLEIARQKCPEAERYVVDLLKYDRWVAKELHDLRHNNNSLAGLKISSKIAITEAIKANPENYFYINNPGKEISDLYYGLVATSVSEVSYGWSLASLESVKSKWELDDIFRENKQLVDKITDLQSWTGGPDIALVSEYKWRWTVSKLRDELIKDRDILSKVAEDLQEKAWAVKSQREHESWVAYKARS